MRNIKTILTTFLITGAITSNAQNQMVDENTIWSCYDNINETNLKYKFEGDSTIGIRKYKKLYVSSEENPFEFSTQNANFAGGVREDGPVVNFIPNGGENAFILYDFSLNTGDNLMFHSFFVNSNNQVQVVAKTGMVYKTETVEIANVSRKKLYIYEPTIVNSLPEGQRDMLDNFADIWIEGIGNVSGLLKRMPIWGQSFEDLPRLNCVTKNGEIIYSNPRGYTTANNDECFVIPNSFSMNEYLGIYQNEDPTSIRNLMASLPKLAPNPAQSSTVISNLPENVMFQIMIINSSGNRVFQGEEKSVDGKITLDLRSLSRGVYHIKLNDGKKPVTLKLMKI
jgi:hypothetical protein